MNDATITREPGHVIPGSMGLVAGGGQTGMTDDLNAVVDAAAEALREAFGRDVSIRYNSDRRSGGAWLKHDGGHWLVSDCQVGITACKVTQEQNDYLRRKYPEWEEDGHVYREPGVYLSIGLAGAVLYDGPLPSEDDWRHAEGLDNKPKFWGSADTVAEAIATVVAMVDPAKLGG